jgi:hypothetical protein
VLQLLAVQSLISINLPGIPREINSIIIQLMQFEVLPSEEMKSSIFKEEDTEFLEESGLNEYFEFYGYGSM